VGQHVVYEEGRMLMGEWLWDLMRCVDYLVSLDEVDQSRIGCGGLSLGGEMAMLLGGMDERIRATSSIFRVSCPSSQNTWGRGPVTGKNRKSTGYRNR